MHEVWILFYVLFSYDNIVIWVKYEHEILLIYVSIILTAEIHNVSTKSAQELEKKILSGEELPVGERNEALQTVYINYTI